MQQKAIKKYKNLTNQKTRHKTHHQHQKKKNTSSNQQCIRHQLHEFTAMKKSRDKRKRMKTIINCEKCKIK